MKPRTVRYRTFAEIADEMAKKHYSEWWRARSDDYLEALIQDHWSGRFIDNAGQSCVFDLYLIRQTGAPAPVTREFVWRLLGDGKPQTVREVHEVSLQLWETLAAAKIEKYGDHVVRGVLGKLALSEADARAWTEQYDKENSPRIQIAGGANKVGRPSLKAEITTGDSVEPLGYASTQKSWTQARTNYWVNRATEIRRRRKSPRATLLQIARKIEKEDAPDHLPDDQKEAWKKKGWTTANIHRRLKGQP